MRRWATPPLLFAKALVKYCNNQESKVEDIESKVLFSEDAELTNNSETEDARPNKMAAINDPPKSNHSLIAEVSAEFMDKESLKRQITVTAGFPSEDEYVNNEAQETSKSNSNLFEWGDSKAG